MNFVYNRNPPLTAVYLYAGAQKKALWRRLILYTNYTMFYYYYIQTLFFQTHKKNPNKNGDDDATKTKTTTKNQSMEKK